MPDLHNFQSNFVTTLDACPSPPLSAMTIYRNTSLSGAAQALADNFPVVCELIGDELFEVLAIEHVRAYPPASPVLALYGKEFPNWLARQPLAAELTYLSDVARCDRLHVEALFAADAPALSLSDVAMIGSRRLPSMRLSQHAAARYDWLATPAMHIWLAHQDGAPDEIVIDWEPGGALFTRPRHAVLARPLSRGEHRLLSGLILGECLGEAAESARSLYPETDISTAFADLVQYGVFAAQPERNF